jgi:hypothetical protein
MLENFVLPLGCQTSPQLGDKGTRNSARVGVGVCVKVIVGVVRVRVVDIGVGVGVGLDVIVGVGVGLDVDFYTGAGSGVMTHVTIRSCTVVLTLETGSVFAYF